MSAPRRNSTQSTPQDVAPRPVQTTPAAIGYGHPEYQFVQAIMEMQKSLGEVNASIAALSRTVESTKSKVDDLVKWKNMILGGAIVIGAVFSFIFLIVTKFSNYIEIRSPEPQAQVHVTAKVESLESTNTEAPRPPRPHIKHSQ